MNALMLPAKLSLALFLGLLSLQPHSKREAVQIIARPLASPNLPL